MNIEQIINDEVYNTESGQKLLKILSKYDVNIKRGSGWWKLLI